MTLIRYNPQHNFRRMNHGLSNWLNNFDSGTMLVKSDFMPKVDISENDKLLIIQAEIPGISKENIKITIDNDNILTLKGSKNREIKEENKEINYHRIERTYGEFSRSFILPDYVNSDSIEAKFNDGVITINIAKIEPKQAKEIEININ